MPIAYLGAWRDCIWLQHSSILGVNSAFAALAHATASFLPAPISSLGASTERWSWRSGPKVEVSMPLSLALGLQLQTSCTKPSNEHNGRAVQNKELRREKKTISFNYARIRAFYIIVTAMSYRRIVHINDGDACMLHSSRS